MSLLHKKKMLADTDAILAKSIERSKNVTLGYFFHLSKKEVAHLSEEDIEAAAENINTSIYQIIRASSPPDESSLIHAYSAVTNLKPLSEAAENSGYFNAFPDSDGTLRWSPLVIKLPGQLLFFIAHFLTAPVPGLADAYPEAGGLWRRGSYNRRY